MMALMMVFTTKACEDAQAYASAAGRRTVTAKDLILGLKYNAVPSTGFYATESLEDKVRAWRESALVGDMVTVAQGGESRTTTKRTVITTTRKRRSGLGTSRPRLRGQGPRGRG